MTMPMQMLIPRPWPIITVWDEPTVEHLLVIGGEADGRIYAIRVNQADCAIPHRRKVAAFCRYNDELAAPVMDELCTWYRRRRFRLTIGDYFHDFEFLAPGDWCDDKVTDHLTGGKYHGCDRRSRPKAPSHPNQEPDSGHTGRTIPFTFYNPAIDAVSTIAVEDAGIRAGEITAWRCWGIVAGSGPGLYSVHMSAHEWPPDRPMQGNVSEFGEGVHAFKHPLAALSYIQNFVLSPDTGFEWVDGYVFGSVDLYGEVIEHEIGYRAEYARIASIDQVYATGRGRRLWGEGEAREFLRALSREHYGLAR